MTLKNEIIGKKILIAGASGDIAQPVINDLIKQSNIMGLTGFNSVERLQKYKSGNVKIYKSDLSNPQNGIDLVNDFASWADGIDILIVLTGDISRSCLFNQISIDEWNSDLSTNVTTPYFMAITAINHMADGGKIVFIGTASAEHGGGIKTFAYGVSKLALEGVTKGLAKFCGEKNILINCVAPGYIKTRMHDKAGKTESDKEKRILTIPLKRAGDVTDISNMILYLISDRNNFITGQVITIDGGDWI